MSKYTDWAKALIDGEYKQLRMAGQVFKPDQAGTNMNKPFFNKNDPKFTPSVPVSTIPYPIGKVIEPLATEPKATSIKPVVDPVNLQATPTKSKTLCFGDSLATGLCHGGAEGNENSDARWGRGAGRTLEVMGGRPDGTFRGNDVVLSTGILNSGLNLDTVRAQINLLNERGAKSIQLVGVPNTDAYPGWNDRLQTIAKETGSTFLGGYKPGSDGVHMPDYSTYIK